MRRAILYCHNVFGLGHIVRTLEIAGAVAARAEWACTVVTGCAHLKTLRIPHGVRLVELPPVRIVERELAEGEGSSRVAVQEVEAVGDGDFGGDVMRYRAERIRSLWSETQPDVMLVDCNPLGLRAEMMPTLLAAAECGGTAFVWGVPYFDGIACRPSPPANPRIRRALKAYSSAMAYLPAESDLFERCPAWLRPEQTVYTGPIRQAPLPLLEEKPGSIVVTCGGGTHAPLLAKLTLAARAHLGRSLSMRIVAGPMADLSAVRAAVAGAPDVEVVPTGEVRDEVRTAAVVVSAAGYNSVSLLMTTELPCVLIPVVEDQRERVAELAGSPGTWCVSPDAEGVVEQLSAALGSALARGRQPRPMVSRSTEGAALAAEWLCAQAVSRAEGTFAVEMAR